MPDGAVKEAVADRIERKLYELEESQRIEERYLSRVDRWMSVCTPAQEKMVRQYVMVQQCRDAKLAADITGYSEEKIYKTRERVLNRIYQRYIR